MQPTATTLSHRARPLCIPICHRGDSSPGGNVPDRFGSHASTVERLAGGAEKVARFVAGGGGCTPERGGPSIDNIGDLLAGFEVQVGGGAEIELDDPALLTEHAFLVEIGPDGQLAHVYEHRDVDAPLFDGGADVSDVDQGRLGNCSLMAALASLADTNPGFIENMITDNGNGTYTVHFGGELGDVTVDDDFALDRHGNPLYARTDTGDGSPELWVAVIEKAYAQANGGYEGIESRWTRDVLTDLTGHDDFTVAPPSRFTPGQMHTALEEGRSVIATSHPRAEGEAVQNEAGIVRNHAYTVLDVRTVDGETQVLVRNPWGHAENGSDSIDDGEFWMSWDDFVTNFRLVEMMDTPLPAAA